MTTPYTTGSIALTNGSAVITGTGTAWLTAVFKGGTIYVQSAQGNPLPLLVDELHPITDTQATAAIPWTGPTGVYSYALVRDTAYGQQVVANAEALSTYLKRLDNASLAALASIASALGAGKVPRGLNANTMEWFTVSDFAKSLMDDADAAAMRATLGNLFAKNLPIANDVRGGNDADFNALPGPGLWSLDRGSNQPCLNAPPDPNKASYQAIQIGNVVRGIQIAFNYLEGSMWVRNGFNTWGAWRLVASSYQSTTVGASGGFETDVGTSGAIKLDVTFVARATNIFASAKWAYFPSIATPLEMYTNIVLRDVTLGVDAKTTHAITTLTGNDSGMGYRGNVSAHLSYNTLTVGNTYQLQLVMWKSQPIGPIYPKNMSIDGLLF